MQYCYDIKNRNNVDSDTIKRFVENLYMDKQRFKNNAFDGPVDELPYVTIYSKPDKSVCILLTGKGKKNIEKIEEIHNSLSSSDLNFDGVSLSKPYVFDVEAQTWWDSTKPKTGGKRWESLRHRGPYFTHLMEPYQPLGATIEYDGRDYRLNPKEEKIARYYANRIISEESGGVTELWTKDSTFNKNFFDGFKKVLTPEHKAIFKDFKKFNFRKLVKLVEADKEDKKNLTKLEKRDKKVLTEEKKREYGYAFIDGNREKVGNYTVEPGAIFYGRGQNPNRGKVKPEIYPEDVTINIGRSDPIPPPPRGRDWGDIVHDQNSVWLAKWNDPISGDVKYVMFSPEGKFKGEGDFVKYEKARKLQKHLTTVRDGYIHDAASSKTKLKQLGTVLYLIDRYGLRVGNEKNADETDTVGASTLRVGHVKLKSPNRVIFDFLGKDSIRFYKELKVDLIIFENFRRFLSDKKSTDDVFDKISAKDINNYLKQFDKAFSAKVFRTRLASVLMYDALKNVEVPEGSTKTRTKTLFNKANVAVADTLNHTRTISKKAEATVLKDKEKLKEKELELKERKKQGKSTVAVEKSIRSLMDKIESKSDTQSVAINTSLNNYIDPRLVVAWAKDQVVPIEYIYTATLLRKFNWAISTTNEDWDYISSPLIGNPELEPVDDDNETSSTVSRKPVSRKPVSVLRKTSPVSVLRKPVVRQSPKRKDIDPSYDILLEICQNNGEGEYDLTDISDEALQWVYPFAKYIYDEGIVDNPTAELIVDHAKYRLNLNVKTNVVRKGTKSKDVVNTKVKSKSRTSTTKSKDSEIKDIIMRSIEKQITMDLTVGLEDNEVKPWNKNRITEYIQNHKKDLQTIVSIIVAEAKQNNDLEEWRKPDPKWIREYLYSNFPAYNKLMHLLTES